MVERSSRNTAFHIPCRPFSITPECPRTISKAHYLQVLPGHFMEALQAQVPTQHLPKPREGRNREREKTKKPAFLRVFRFNQWAALDLNQ